MRSELLEVVALCFSLVRLLSQSSVSLPACTAAPLKLTVTEVLYVVAPGPLWRTGQVL